MKSLASFPRALGMPGGDAEGLKGREQPGTSRGPCTPQRCTERVLKPLQASSQPLRLSLPVLETQIPASSAAVLQTLPPP